MLEQAQTLIEKSRRMLALNDTELAMQRYRTVWSDTTLALEQALAEIERLERPNIVRRAFEAIWCLLPDRCEMPECSRKGVRGNENVIDGKRVCDYCHAKMMQRTV